MAKKTVRLTYASETKQVSEEDRTLVVRISTPKPDRSNDIVDPKGADIADYLRNPVVALNHDYRGLAIGKTEELNVTDDGIMAKVKFPRLGVYPLADTVFQLYKDGFMNAWSIGFIPKKFSELENGGKNFEEWELLEYSAVLVPDNPEALTLIRSKGFDLDKEGHIIEKSVVPYKDLGTMDEGAEWSASKEMAKVDQPSDWKLMSTWYDSENSELKGSYKLPHHSGDTGHKAIWRGVAAAMAALMGARGGVDIPDSDRRGVYNHLSKHYTQYDREAPEFSSYNEAELKEIEETGVLAPKPDYVLDQKTRIALSDSIVLMKNTLKRLEELLLAQPVVEEPKTVIDLVSGLKMADKAIGIALRNYKQGKGRTGHGEPDDASLDKESDKEAEK